MSKPEGSRSWSAFFHSERSKRQSMVPGSRFITTDFDRGVWEVVAVAPRAGHVIPHARLARVGMPSDTKTVSVGVLADRHFYLPADKV